MLALWSMEIIDRNRIKMKVKTRERPQPLTTNKVEQFWVKRREKLIQSQLPLRLLMQIFCDMNNSYNSSIKVNMSLQLCSRISGFMTFATKSIQDINKLIYSAICSTQNAMCLENKQSMKQYCSIVAG